MAQEFASQAERFALTGRYLYRKHLALQLVNRLQCSYFLEIGFGSADFMLTLGRTGRRGVGIDLSAEAVEAARKQIRARGLEDRLEVLHLDVDELQVDTPIDLIVALEVLEHIESDVAVMHKLLRILQPGGYVVLSVPAHMKWWGASDVWAGHFRRYERDELISKLSEAGFEVREVLSYGFPVMSLVVGLRHRLFARHLDAAKSIEERTAQSGIKQVDFLRRTARIATIYFQIARLLGWPFVRTDWGDGFVAVARRPVAGEDS